MEVSVMRCSQTTLQRNENEFRQLGFCNSRQICPKIDRIGFKLTGIWKSKSCRVALRAIRSEISAVAGKKLAKGNQTQEKTGSDGVRLFVGLPADAVSDCNTLNNTRAIAAGLKALKLLGIEGVELSIWWGIVEKEAAGKYDWSSYLALAEMVRSVGLNLRVSLCFHASTEPVISLPEWVSRIGETHPDIFFADRAGKRYKECLTMAVDELPVLDGKTPMQVYQAFFDSFRSSFSDFIGSTITDVCVGLGPDGELRYPSFPSAKAARRSPGMGEFQCYDKHMLDNLRRHAEITGNPLWGLGGPHDAPTYDQSPDSNSFFRDNGGSWETPYGQFFLSWYAHQLITHGDRLLSLASATFADSPITLSGKVPLIHSWYKTRSHPSELTAGFFNSAGRDGYDAVAEIFARNSCQLVLPGLDLCDNHQPQNSSPESLVMQIMGACEKHGVHVAGENSSVSKTPDGFSKIKERLDKGLVGSFIYQRMGASFFSPDHWPLFMDLVWSINRPELDSDDLPDNEDEDAKISLTAAEESGKNLEMQTA